MGDRRYRVVYNRAVVLDAPGAIYGPVLRDEAILGHLPYGAEIRGPVVSVPISPDLTAHAVQITYPLDVPSTSGVVAYVLRSELEEIVTHVPEVTQ